MRPDISVRRLKILAFAVAALVIGTLAGTAVIGTTVLNLFGSVQESWRDYIGGAEAKEFYLNRIRAAFGYGGFIHNFKNYVLRQDPRLVERVENNLRKLESAISSYEAVGVSDEEAAALARIRAVVEEYWGKFAIAQEFAEAGRTPRETDKLVRVDDTAALEALALLEGVWLDARDQETERVTGTVEKGTAMIWTGLLALPIVVAAGFVPAWFLRRLVREIAHRRQAEEALREANAELEAFTYSVSHDLRAPLRSIHGFSQVLLEDYADKVDAEGRDYLGRVGAGSKKMGQLIDDLLKLSRVSRGEIERRRFDLSELAQTIAAELREAAPDRQATFDIAPVAYADGDPRLLRIVLENLLGNAWKFTGTRPQARIEFGVTEHDGKPAYYVRDDGAGFDMAYADKLFKPFQRLHKTEEFPGTGIGLATVARIVHRHGGRVWAESAVEQGTTVYFSLGTKLVTKGEAV